MWNDTEAEVVYPEGITEEELKKREDEEKKKAAEETEETQTQAKRRGAKLYIYGNGFLNDPNLMVSFIWSGSVTKKVKPIYKNTKKLAIEPGAVFTGNCSMGGGVVKEMDPVRLRTEAARTEQTAQAVR